MYNSLPCAQSVNSKAGGHAVQHLIQMCNFILVLGLWLVVSILVLVRAVGFILVSGLLVL